MSLLRSCEIELCSSSYHVLSVRFLNSAIMTCYYILQLFPVSACPISLHMYFVIRVCRFVCSSLMLRIFWYAVIDNRLSTSKLHYDFTVLYFWLLFFRLGSLNSFQSHFCCSYYFVYSFLFGICLCRLLLCSVFVRWNGTTDFAKTGQVSDDTINLINC